MASCVLVVTNDFPPRRGGIESFVQALCFRMPPEQVVVYTASMPGSAEFDAELPFPVVRDPANTLLPTPLTARRVVDVFRRHACDRVVFGAAAPLGLLAPTLRSVGARRIVGLTHGHEVWWARVPGPRRALRRIGETCDVLTYVSEWCRAQIAPVLSPRAAEEMVRLAPGVDVERFRPGSGGARARRRLGLPPDVPVVVCAARMVRRKGQDTLVDVWPQVREEVPDARLLLVGDGPGRSRLERLAHPLGDAVIFSEGTAWDAMPALLDAGDVFAMPCRTRRFGLEAEALGIVVLEAAACALPVIVGASGGAPETVRHGETGYVVNPRNGAAVAEQLTTLLRDRALATSMGDAGRAWACREWSWERAAAQLHRVLA